MNPKNTLNKLIFLIALLCLYHPTPLKALTPKAEKTSTPSANITKIPTNEKKQIDELKEKIATKVASMREKDKGVLTGSVKQIGTQSFLVVTQKGEKKINFADDTLFYLVANQTKSEIKADKIKVNDIVSGFGYFDLNRDQLTAKFIYSPKTTRSHIRGRIADVDKTNFTITVKEKQSTFIIDIETTTKIGQFVKGKGLVKIGFSKLKIGDQVNIISSIPISDKATGISIAVLPAPSKLPTPTPTIGKVTPELSASPSAKVTPK